MKSLITQGISSQLSIILKFRDFIGQRVNEFQPAYTTFGIFGIFNYPFFYFVWIAYSKQGYENLTLRLIAAGLSLLLLAHNYWPSRLKPWLPIYWYFTLTFCLPFFFFYMLFQNSGSTPWLMSADTIFFWLLLLIPFTDYLVLLLLGILIAYFAYAIPNAAFFNFNLEKWWGIWTQLLASVVVVGFFAKRKFYLDLQKLDSAKLLAGTIAHELRTPLASIKGGATGLKIYLPKLLHAYKRAHEEKISDIEVIRPVQVEALEQSLSTIEKEASASNLIITMLLTNLSTNQIAEQQFSMISMNHCVTEALARYPLNEELKAKIHWQPAQDFLFYGSEVLTIHILFNLLKNAIYYIRAAERGEIFINVETSQTQNILFFKDTSVGIDAKDLSNIFKQFYSRTRHGTGVGLAFCKSVMKSYGGDIICRSEKGSYTEFVLNFPKNDTPVA